MMPGTPERATHDYVRHGTTSLFAAFNIADGTVIGELHRRHRAAEFQKFLTSIDKAVPEELDIHLVCGRGMDAHWVNDRAGYRCRHGPVPAHGENPCPRSGEPLAHPLVLSMSFPLDGR